MGNRLGNIRVKHKSYIGNCEICGKEQLVYKAYPRRFCSNRCKLIGQVKDKVSISCPTCNKLFRPVRKSSKYCSKQCQLVIFKKECIKKKTRNIALRIEIRNLYKYNQWRQAVRKRDNYTCTRCGSPGLETHHDVSFISLLRKHNIKTLAEAIACKELWDINNGTTVCLACHWLMHPHIKARDNNIVVEGKKVCRL